MSVISKVNLEYIKLQKINKYIVKFLKIIRDLKVDPNCVGYITGIVKNRNIKFKYKKFKKCIALKLTDVGCS